MAAGIGLQRIVAVSAPERASAAKAQAVALAGAYELSELFREVRVRSEPADVALGREVGAAAVCC